MPVTIKISDHEANLITQSGLRNDTGSILSTIEPGNRAGQVIQSSFGDKSPHPFKANANGFVQTIVDAYNYHHHVVIRPDDIWLAVMTQFASYVGAHAEDLRKEFVAHDYLTVDYADFVTRIGHLIEENVVDPELRAWIVPTFSTTTPTDTIVSSIVMMGALQHYFQYFVSILCGIPSVTLLGEKSDYEDILGRLDKFQQYGEEPTHFTQLLRPILTRIIRSMDEPNSPDTVAFWRHICVVDNGSGFDEYNGWITAFCFWNKDGRFQLSSQSRLREEAGSQFRRQIGREILRLDDVYYGQIDSRDVPAAYVKLPVQIMDDGVEIKAEMLSGSVAIYCTSSGRVSAGENGSVGVDTMQPRSGWFIYEIKS
ncbi:hypothetical protein O1611_g1490 [Lasiodiplodia mahajangana]|uniref:Uncharacterized protein n=1 Tax=Lasiodiplodia mahajangana TaxID=1108764 RepID=A0ACC2JXS8_9PEZI|nr:hypothetical protein O1611_g1490 [Lasiodiplodia mahajangana]